MTFSENWNQPDHIAAPLWGPSPEIWGHYVQVTVFFDHKNGATQEDTLARAQKWVEEQRKISAEINQWVDDELKEYKND